MVHKLLLFLKNHLKDLPVCGASSITVQVDNCGPYRATSLPTKNKSEVPDLRQYVSESKFVTNIIIVLLKGERQSEGQRCFWPRGKALGGTSVINYMLYIRVRPQDWDRIAADGNYGWNYDEVWRYYIKSEKSELKTYRNIPYRGCDGELTVSHVPFKTGLVEAFLKAERDLGSPTVDYNSAYELGYTQAIKIILSARPIASPQLLMLSGIGSKEHLRSMGIPVLVNLQVGRVLYDHISFPGVIFKLNTTNVSLLEPKVATLANVLQCLLYGDGLLTTKAEALGYLKTSVFQNPENVLDIVLLSGAGSLNLDSVGAVRQSWRLSESIFHQAFGPLYGSHTWSAVIMLTQPKSKGYLELKDTNPFSHPKMYGNYFTDPQDMAAMIEAVKHIIQRGKSEPFKKFDPQLHLADFTLCRKYYPGSDEYWKCVIKNEIITLHHQISPSRMGPPSDPYAVVDPELRVYGVEGLRVVDSSVIPRPVNAHTVALAIMIGEKAADMIKRAWSNVVS